MSNKRSKFSFLWRIISNNNIPVYEVLLGLCFIFIKMILSTSIYYQKFFSYEAPFYDTGTLMSLLICLEHLFVSYYLIIIIIMVYWCLYIFIVDFVCWNSTNYNYSIKYIIHYITNIFYKNILSLYMNIYILFLSFLNSIKEREYLWFISYSHVNFGRDSSIPKKFLGLFPFHFKKKYLNRINIINIFSNNVSHFDILGRSITLINKGILKFIIVLTLFKESIYVLKRLFKFSTYILKKKMTYYLYYTKPRSFFFLVSNEIIYVKNKKYSLNYSNWLINIRSNYNDLFNLNQFKHSGVFEAVWATFPTVIIILILIPSLILLYSFEDILNPKLSVKVIGNQWYWTYEFNNWITFKEKNEDNNIVDRNVYMSYAFNSVIMDLDSLESGYKRLLEVDNRLVLSTNVTTRFLVSSADVLHSFAMPELGFKIDANPGRLNQILVYISRPGVYYGQCSELCGNSHAFMPIVIQAVSPINFLNYMEKIKKL